MKNTLTIDKKGELTKYLTLTDIGKTIKPLTKEIHLFDSFVAGTSYLVDKTVLSEINAGDKLVLRREKTNNYDANAIVIMTEKGKKLGYIPEKDNIIFARLMDAGKLLIAKIAEIEHLESFSRIRIGIFLVDF